MKWTAIESEANVVRKFVVCFNEQPYLSTQKHRPGYVENLLADAFVWSIKHNQIRQPKEGNKYE